MMKGWRHKSEWSKYGKDFMVSVSRHDDKIMEGYGKGPHRWCVYAYIYPKHRLFSKFSHDGGIFQEAANSLPMHQGPSLFTAHRANPDDRDAVTAFQIGSDYTHLHDNHYTFQGDDDFPSKVEDDAQELFDYLQAKGVE